MSQKIKSKQSTANSWLGKIGFSFGAVLLLSSTGANAFPVSESSIRLLSQTPPDVIINPSGSGSRIPSTPTSSGSGSTVSTGSNGTRFTCQSYNGQYTVMYRPESQPGQAYAWAIPGQMGGGWNEERRCSEISARLERYRPDGLIDLTTSQENGENILCVTTEKDPGCRIVLTVPRGQDPQETRDAVFQNLTVADSGQQTQGVNTYTGGGKEGDILNQIGGVLGVGKSSNSSADGINLKPFLDPKDGGTGDRLKPANKSNSRSLSPDRFR
ncbi:MAG: COP23 domain-containing protein [Xenococcaceae cyanobacterium]